jgi:hypothetical protein
MWSNNNPQYKHTPEQSFSPDDSRGYVQSVKPGMVFNPPPLPLLCPLMASIAGCAAPNR